MAAHESAAFLALYGHPEEAETALSSVDWSWRVPPRLRSEAILTCAVMAYARGDYAAGLAFADEAVRRAGRFPRSRPAKLAVQTYRNLGLVLTGQATETTVRELRRGFRRLPLPSRILAAWGLAVLAKRAGDTAVYGEKRRFIESAAPHFVPVLRSLEGVGEGSYWLLVIGYWLLVMRPG